jgi:Cobalamin-independent synthase, Catalytic domain
MAWVQSYGSRCVAAPIIWGDVSRPVPMNMYLLPLDEHGHIPGTERDETLPLPLREGVYGEGCYGRESPMRLFTYSLR